jgi:hypothetical protein
MTTVRLPKTVDEPAMILSRIYELGEANQYLEVATSESNCDDAPPELLGIGSPSDSGYFPFRISPSGERFLGVAFENSDHLLYTWGPSPAPGNWLLVANPDLHAHMAWYDDTTIGLTMPRDDGQNSYFFEMYQVPDKNDVQEEEATLMMTCEETPEEERVLPTGQFLFRDGILFVESDYMIYRLSPVDGMYDCSIASDQNVLLASGASHFDVSDDGLRLTFQDEDASGIYTAPANELGTPQLISPEDGAQHRFPKFALSGEQVVWTSSYLFDEAAEVPLAEGNFTRVYRANFDGSYPFVLFQDDVPSEETTEATTGDQRGSTCSFGLPLGGGSGGMLALGLGVAAALRRRRLSQV